MKLKSSFGWNFQVQVKNSERFGKPGETLNETFHCLWMTLYMVLLRSCNQLFYSAFPQNTPVATIWCPPNNSALFESFESFCWPVLRNKEVFRVWCCWKHLQPLFKSTSMVAMPTTCCHSIGHFCKTSCRGNYCHTKVNHHGWHRWMLLEREKVALRTFHQQVLNVSSVCVELCSNEIFVGIQLVFENTLTTGHHFANKYEGCTSRSFSTREGGE